MKKYSRVECPEVLGVINDFINTYGLPAYPIEYPYFVDAIYQEAIIKVKRPYVGIITKEMEHLIFDKIEQATIKNNMILMIGDVIHVITTKQLMKSTNYLDSFDNKIYGEEGLILEFILRRGINYSDNYFEETWFDDNILTYDVFKDEFVSVSAGCEQRREATYIMRKDENRIIVDVIVPDLINNNNPASLTKYKLLPGKNITYRFIFTENKELTQSNPFKYVVYDVIRQI